MDNFFFVSKSKDEDVDMELLGSFQINDTLPPERFDNSNCNSDCDNSPPEGSLLFGEGIPSVEDTRKLPLCISSSAGKQFRFGSRVPRVSPLNSIYFWDECNGSRCQHRPWKSENSSRHRPDCGISEGTLPAFGKRWGSIYVYWSLLETV